MLQYLVIKPLILILGFAYPAYSCFKALEVKRPDHRALQFWCKYWVILALLTVVEWLLQLFIFWVPFYLEAKLVLLIYMWHPKTLGADYVYRILLLPLLTKHQATLDRHISEIQVRGSDVAARYWELGKQYVRAKFGELLAYLAEQSIRAQQQARRNGRNSLGGRGFSSPPPYSFRPQQYYEEVVDEEVMEEEEEYQFVEHPNMNGVGGVAAAGTAGGTVLPNDTTWMSRAAAGAGGEGGEAASAVEEGQRGSRDEGNGSTGSGTKRKSAVDTRTSSKAMSPGKSAGYLSKLRSRKSSNSTPGAT